MNWLNEVNFVILKVFNYKLKVVNFVSLESSSK